MPQVFDNETRSGSEIKSGDRLSGQHVSYAYTDNVTRNPDTSSEGILAYDSFTYYVDDSDGAWSTVGIASLSIISRLTAVTAQSRNDSSWICVEDTASAINVYVQDSITSRRNVTIVISVVPEHGSLLRATTNSTLMTGDALDTDCTDTNYMGYLSCVSSLMYLPNRNYFNSPTSKWNGDEVGGTLEADIFSFYAVASNNGEYSNEAVQDIRVVNSNDPSVLQCPKHVQYVQAVGTGVYARGVGFVPLDSTAIGGVSITDLDKGVDVVKVKVFASFGLLSLNEMYITLLDFNSAAFCYEADTSQCVGSGTGDRELIFIAEPSHAQMALNGMVYQSVISNVVDTINIIVLDGANGDCLSENKLLSGSVRQGCWQASCQFDITVGTRQLALDVASNNNLSVEVWVSVGVGLCVLAYIAWRRFLHCCCHS